MDKRVSFVTHAAKFATHASHTLNMCDLMHVFKQYDIRTIRTSSFKLSPIIKR